MHGPLCRLCQSADERTFHMGSCPFIKEIFSNLLRLDRIDINNPTEVLLAVPSAKMGTRCLAAVIINRTLSFNTSIQSRPPRLPQTRP
jgi:hypothetical protein